MPLYIIRQDITKMEVDAIVNAANSSLRGGGGVDGAIHRAAGPELLAECITLGGCATGDAKITRGYKLPAKQVIHVVGPVWKGGNMNEKALLESCYRRALSLAREKGCESIAFPLISSGIYGYPKDKAFRVAVDMITEFLSMYDMTVYITVFDSLSYKIGTKLFADIEEYIDDNYVDSEVNEDVERLRRIHVKAMNCAVMPKNNFEDRRDPGADIDRSSKSQSLDRVLLDLDESFSEMLLRKIDEKGMTDSQCYKKANIDRKLFSKIRGDKYYKPSKITVISFAIALELSLAETEDMLKKAGFALSHSNKFDVIIEYFIKKRIYDIFEINEALFAFDQSLLGG